MTRPRKTLAAKTRNYGALRERDGHRKAMGLLEDKMQDLELHVEQAVSFTGFVVRKGQQIHAVAFTREEAEEIRNEILLDSGTTTHTLSNNFSEERNF